MEGDEEAMSTENGAQAGQQAPSSSWQQVPSGQQRVSETWQKVPSEHQARSAQPEQQPHAAQFEQDDVEKTTMLDPSMAPPEPQAQPEQQPQPVQFEQDDVEKTTMLDPSMAPPEPQAQLEQQPQPMQPGAQAQPQPMDSDSSKTTMLDPSMAPPEPTGAMQAAEMQVPVASEQAAQPKRAGKPWKWVAAVAAVVVVVGIGVAAFFAIQAQTYDKAAADYAAGNYAQAAEGFKNVGGYQDAAAMYEKSSRWVEAQAAEQNATDSGDAELWRAAAAAYEAIGDDGAVDKVEWCNGNADYLTAMGMLEKTPTDRAAVTEALALLKKCPAIADAEAQASYCENVLKYYEAEDLLAAGHFYDAYKAYGKVSKAAAEKLGDVDKKRNSCIQPLPGTGVVQRNTNAADDCELKIVNEGMPNAYYKLYMGDNLVLTVFIAAGDTATFMLPSGTYSMNKAYGDTWFGTEDLFGDEGHYFKCDFGGSATVGLEPNYGYEISANTEGTNVGAQATGRDKI